MSTRTWPQRIISEADLRFAGYLRAPHEAKVTALGLWPRTDLAGRRPLHIAEIAAELYPEDDPPEAETRVELHILMLEESGFLVTYVADGEEWLALHRPLRGDRRGRAATSPEPPQTAYTARSPLSMESVAVERERAWARERARERVRGEEEADARRWETWRAQAQTPSRRRPGRPLLLSAPPLGCVDHPDGTQEPCGPCGTARKYHERWLARERYEDQLAVFDEDSTEGAATDDDEPF